MKSEGEKFTDYLEEQEFKTLKSYALRSRERQNQLGKYFREHKPKSPLEFRTEYHRDRDRILWSKAFKRLQHKTQVFPHYVEDHYKRRLTHSLEVAQIATTVARALRLNEVATEAIALGHDLGHTPFGHAGEKALNLILTGECQALSEKTKKEFNELNRPKTKNTIPISGFDHCVHAIEVVSRILKEYHSETKHGGLNLTFDVRDGILKHMCSREDAKVKKERPFSNIPGVVKLDKYKEFKDNKGSLEAQCVYFADKVTYLLGDIEDGIRSGIFKCRRIRKSDEGFFDQLEEKLKKPKYRGPQAEVKLDEPNDFGAFRSAVLTTLILDCIDSAKQNINKNGLEQKGVEDVLLTKQRIVFISNELEQAWRDFYQRWMFDYLFKNERVEACTFKAVKVMTDLFNAYYQNPDLINSKYYEHCENVYKKIGISNKKLLKLIIVRNYIAGMTDPFASDQHARLYMSLERIRF